MENLIGNLIGFVVGLVLEAITGVVRRIFHKLTNITDVPLVRIYNPHLSLVDGELLFWFVTITAEKQSAYFRLPQIHPRELRGCTLRVTLTDEQGSSKSYVGLWLAREGNHHIARYDLRVGDEPVTVPVAMKGPFGDAHVVFSGESDEIGFGDWQVSLEVREGQNVWQKSFHLYNPEYDFDEFILSEP